MLPTELTVGTLDGCNHCFCFDCANKWLDSCSACPLCKTSTSFLLKHVLVEPLSSFGRDMPEIHRALPPARERIPIQPRQLRSDNPEGDPPADPYDVCEGMFCSCTGSIDGGPCRGRCIWH
jgi:Ring finger domain